MNSTERHLFHLLYLLLLLFCSCSAPRTQTILSMTELSCARCGLKSASSLRNLDGIYDAQFHRGKAEISIVHDAEQITPTDLSTFVAKLGYTNRIGPNQGRYTQRLKPTDGLDILTFKPKDDTLELADIIANGRVTIVDFFAVWCGPCHELDRVIQDYMKSNRSVAYRRIDIGQWSSPVAKKYLGAVPELPYAIIFDGQGRQIDSISGLDIPRVLRALKKGQTQ